MDVDRDEMEYVDGGYYVDFSKDYLQYLVDGMLVVFGGVAIAAGMYVGIYPNQAKLLGIITGLLGGSRNYSRLDSSNCY